MRIILFVLIALLYGCERSSNNGQSVSADADSGTKMLLSAIWSGDVGESESIIQHNSLDLDVSLPEHGGKTPLMIAIDAGETDIAAILLDHDADCCLIDDFGFSALIYAARESNLDMVQMLLDAGADVHHVSHSGSTAIMSAVGNADVVRLLLNAGADPFVRDQYQHTALRNAVVVGSTGSAQVLLDAGVTVHDTPDPTDSTLLRDATLGGNVELVRLVLADGRDVNLATASGETSLIAAAVSGHVAIVKALLEAGADPNAMTDEYQTALGEVTWRHKTELALPMVRMLLDAGADVNPAALPPNVPAPIHYAASGECLECVRLMVEAGADIEARNHYGYTALLSAVNGGLAETVQYLIDAGADPNVEAEPGRNAYGILKGRSTDLPGRNKIKVILDRYVDS